MATAFSWVSGTLLVCALSFACNSPLPAPTKSGPAPEYEEPGEEAGAPLNPNFEAEATKLFQNEGGQALKACQTEAQAQGKFEGTIQVHVVIRPDGGLVAVEPRNDSGLPPTLVDCLTRTLTAMHFPSPGGDRNLSFELPLQFVAEPAAPPAEAPVDAGPADAGAAKKPKAKK